MSNGNVSVASGPVNTDECPQFIPTGRFPDDIDTGSQEKMVELLSREKHQLLEGLVVEDVAEQFIQELEAEAGFSVLDVIIMIAKGDPRESYTSGQYCVFFWPRGEDPIDDLIVAFQRLADGCDRTTYICKEKDYRFYLSKPGRSDWKPLQKYLCEKRKFNPEDIRFPEISESVRDEKRQKSTLYGRLESVYGDDLVGSVVLPRIYKNYLIQPFFEYGWDLDRIFRYNKKLWEFELKHKYPIDNYDFYKRTHGTDHRLCLSFGINQGQAALVEKFAAQGINTLHLILVKPKWTDQEDPGYLYVKEEARKKTLVVGAVITKEKAQEILSGKLKKSSGKASYSGKGDLNYYQIPRTFFHVIGNYAEGSENLAPRIKALLDGELNMPLTAEILLENCMYREERSNDGSQN